MTKNTVSPQPLYAVFGRPIAHSLSPQIHQCFAQQEGVALIYEKREVTQSLAETLAIFAKQGGIGANVTLPCKIEAYAWANELSAAAQAAGAVNTLHLCHDTQGRRWWLGDNTDGIGLVRDLKRLLGDFTQQRILIIGAGGAAQGIVPALLSTHPRQLVITNRTQDKAQALAARFAIEWATLSQIGGTFDLIINATAASLSQDLPPVPASVFQAASLAYDLAYAPDATPFMRFAQAQGSVQVADGLGMLVEQAAAAYHLWRGFTPQTGHVLDVMRQYLSKNLTTH